MWHTTIKILQDGIRVYDIPRKVNMMLDDSVILLTNWEAQERKLKIYSGRLYDQVLKLHYLGFTVLPAVALTLQLSKIASQVWKAKCVLWYHRSVVQVQKRLYT
jgi:hypothetical protein